MSCFVFEKQVYDCCEDPYVLTQRDEVHQCIREEVLSMTRESFNSLNALLDAGMATDPYWGKTIDLQILLDWLKDKWDELEIAYNAGTLDLQDFWDDLPINCMARYFRCEYGVNIMRAVHSAGLYDPSKPLPGTDIPSPGVA